MRIFIKNENGKPSVSLTMVVIAFLLTALSFTLNMFNFTLYTWLTLRPFDVPAVTAFFTPILALYFGRRFTNDKNCTNGNSVPPQNP